MATRVPDPKPNGKPKTKLTINKKPANKKKTTKKKATKKREAK